jgi:hypothetical protein
MLAGIAHLAPSTYDAVVVQDKVRLDVQMLMSKAEARLLLTREEEI